MRRDDFGGAPDERIRGALGHGIDRGARVTRYLAETGDTILLGSDTPSGPTYGNPPGLNGFLEMRRLAASGVSLTQLLDAATPPTPGPSISTIATAPWSQEKRPIFSYSTPIDWPASKHGMPSTR